MAVELKTSGAFLGDCGLTYQDVEGLKELEVGYHDRKSTSKVHGFADTMAIGWRRRANCLAIVCVDLLVHRRRLIGSPAVVSSTMLAINFVTSGADSSIRFRPRLRDECGLSRRAAERRVAPTP